MMTLEQLAEAVQDEELMFVVRAFMDVRESARRQRIDTGAADRCMLVRLLLDPVGENLFICKVLGDPPDVEHRIRFAHPWTPDGDDVELGDGP